MPGATLKDTQVVLQGIHEERKRQNKKWGTQHHPDGTGLPGDKEKADLARDACDGAAKDGTLTWRHITDEELAEAYAEKDKAKLYIELEQTAAVLAAWQEDLLSQGLTMYEVAMMKKEIADAKKAAKLASVCHRCGGTKQDPENTGPCWDCEEKPAVPEPTASADGKQYPPDYYCPVCPHAKFLHNADGSCPCGLNCPALRTPLAEIKPCRGCVEKWPLIEQGWHKQDDLHAASVCTGVGPEDVAAMKSPSGDPVNPCQMCGKATTLPICTTCAYPSLTKAEDCVHGVDCEDCYPK